MPLITKEYKFCAAHRYWNDKWSKEENFNVFGDDIRNHGHNYILRITVKGKINPEALPTSTNTVAIRDATTT